MDILLTGSIAYDYLMSFPGYFRDHILPDRVESISLSFLVESMVRQRGGIAPNIAYTLALLGGRPRLLATVGEDFEEYREWLEARGIDTSNVEVIVGEFTASFFVNTDRMNAQIASFYPGAMAHAAQQSFHRISGAKPDLVVISPNDPDAMKRFAKESAQLSIPYIYDPSQQIVRLDGDDLRRGVEGALALFVNDYEFGLLQKKTGMNPQNIMDHLGFMVVTRGEHGSTVYEGERTFDIPSVPPEEIVDPTGMGDAFRGGFLTGYCHQWSWDLCGRLGAMAATYCLERQGPQGHAFSLNEFATRFREHFNDGGVLDALIS